jgi:hypothetical protein
MLDDDNSAHAPNLQIDSTGRNVLTPTVEYGLSANAVSIAPDQWSTSFDCPIIVSGTRLHVWANPRFPSAAFAFLLNRKKECLRWTFPNVLWTLRLFGVWTRFEQLRSLSRRPFPFGDGLGQPNQVETVVNLCSRYEITHRGFK